MAEHSLSFPCRCLRRVVHCICTYDADSRKINAFLRNDRPHLSSAVFFYVTDTLPILHNCTRHGKTNTIFDFELHIFLSWTWSSVASRERDTARKRRNTSIDSKILGKINDPRSSLSRVKHFRSRASQTKIVHASRWKLDITGVQNVMLEHFSSPIHCPSYCSLSRFDVTFE